ncbi:MAG: hypothetical protein ACOX4J_04335 [Anaerovoracaceae bacterium]
MGEEGLKETSHGSIFIGKPVPPTPALAEILNRGENALEEEVYNISQRSIEEIKEWLRSIVPNYTNGNGTTEVTIHINEERNVMDE